MFGNTRWNRMAKNFSSSHPVIEENKMKKKNAQLSRQIFANTIEANVMKCSFTLNSKKFRVLRSDISGKDIKTDKL